MPLTLEQQTIFDQYERLFNTDGWRELVADLKVKMDNLKDQGFRSVNQDNLRFVQGQYAAFEYITSLQGTLEQVKKQVEETNADEQIDLL